MTAIMQIIEYGTTTIEYQLRFADRKTLGIDVHPDLTVTVTAPEGSTPEAVAMRVRRRIPWILKQQRELELYLPKIPPRQYVSGETHRYLGRQYRLNVEEGTRKGVKLTRGFLTVVTQDKTNADRVRMLVEGWYRTQAQRVFPERLENMLSRFTPVADLAPTLAIRKMELRWGSCTEEGLVTLNLKLMQVPKPCIDYIIVHELCHLVEHNHSTAFYRLLDRMMPDWRIRRRELNESDFA